MDRESRVVFAVPDHYPTVQDAVKAAAEYSHRVEAAMYLAHAAAKRAAKSFRDFERRVMEAASEAFLRHHARLPGSTRTARLRKKRRDAVVRWYREQENA